MVLTAKFRFDSPDLNHFPKANFNFPRIALIVNCQELTKVMRVV